jgi:YHS domain-containing protein
MTDKQKPKPGEENYVTCKVCMKEVPLSAAKSDEASDYVYYFCGPDCYAKWRLKEGANK